MVAGIIYIQLNIASMVLPNNKSEPLFLHAVVHISKEREMNLTAVSLIDRATVNVLSNKWHVRK